MEVKIIEDSGKRLVVEIEGETHTLLNLIQKELWNDKSTKVAGYNIDHPLKATPRLIIEVSSGSAKDALIEAAKRAKADVDKLKKAFEKASKE